MESHVCLGLARFDDFQWVSTPNTSNQPHFYLLGNFGAIGLATHYLILQPAVLSCYIRLPRLLHVHFYYSMSATELGLGGDRVRLNH